MDASTIEAFLSQAIGGGTSGNLQTTAAFSAGLADVQSAVASKLSGLGSVLGTLGLGQALQTAATSAQASSTAQQQSLLKSLGLPAGLTSYILPLAVLGLLTFLFLRKK